MAEAQLEDPFDIRVKNTLAVLDVLSTYATLETDHFIIRFDRGRDELLARYVADYLEQDVYPDLVKRFGFRAARQVADRDLQPLAQHQWARLVQAGMVGVPGLHTIGCAGKIVALASPTDMPRPYNWARVSAARVRASAQSGADVFQRAALGDGGTGGDGGGPSAAQRVDQAAHAGTISTTSCSRSTTSTSASSAPATATTGPARMLRHSSTSSS